MLLMFKSLLSLFRPGLLLLLGASLPLPGSAGEPAALVLPRSLLLPGYGDWINEADCVEELAVVPPVAQLAAPAAAAVVAPAAAAEAPVVAPWQLLASDQTLKTALMRWAASAGWQLVWEAPLDYAVERDTAVGGSFEQAIEAVAHSMAGAETPLQAIFYKGNRVIRIVAKGAQS
jgi:hypothetical protein